MTAFLGRKASVLLVLVAVLLAAAVFLPATEFSTLATAVPALYLAFVGAHSAQQVMRKPPPAPDGGE